MKATATDPGNNTSEFSQCAATGKLPPPPISVGPFAYVTNGAWRNPLHQGAEGVALSKLAAATLDGAG